MLTERRFIGLAAAGMVPTAIFFYCWYTLFHSHLPTDDGCMLAMSWRIFHGEVPHRDYLTTKPPLTHIIHAIWFFFPEGYQYKASRVAYFVEMWAIGLIPLWVLFRRHIQSALHLWFAIFLTFVGVVFSIHNFPPMPWPTIDGLFLSTLGLALMTRGFEKPAQVSLKWACAGAFFCGMAPFAKQNFGLVPLYAYAVVVIGLALTRQIGWISKIKKALIIGVFMATPGAIFLAFLITTGALKDFWTQMNVMAPTGFVRGMFWSYSPTTWENAAWMALGLAIGGVASWVGRRRKDGLGWVQTALLFAPIAVVLAFVYRFIHLSQLDAITSSVPLFRISYGILFGCWIGNFERLRAYPQIGFFGFGAVLLGVMAAISGGYYFPILGLAPLISSIGFFYVVPELNRKQTSVLAILFVAAFSGSLWQALQWYELRPYQEAPVSEQKYDLATLYPRFGSKLTTKERTFRRYSNLKKLSDRFEARYPGRPQVVVPEFPLFYFLSNRRNPTSEDWWVGHEFNFVVDRMQAQFLASKPVVFIEYADDDTDCSKYPGTPEIVPWLRQVGKQTDREGTFCAYEIQ